MKFLKILRKLSIDYHRSSAMEPIKHNSVRPSVGIFEIFEAAGPFLQINIKTHFMGLVPVEGIRAGLDLKETSPNPSLNSASFLAGTVSVNVGLGYKTALFFFFLFLINSPLPPKRDKFKNFLGKTTILKFKKKIGKKLLWVCNRI